MNADETWRDPVEVATGRAGGVGPRLIEHRTRGPFWDVLSQAGVTLLVTREHEHLVVGLDAAAGKGEVTTLALPHPSGIAFDERRGLVHVASTRNPNQVVDLAPVLSPGWVDDAGRGTLVPVRSRTLPGRLYLHDLALIGGRLHGNAVGENSIVRLDDDGSYRRVWSPRLIEEAPGGEGFSHNYLQLNSIAAGRSLTTSFFSASTDVVGTRRPGHRNFAVDGRGVVFSGRTGEPMARGLTRPHSARLADGRLWVDNSGYGEVGLVADGGFTPVARLPGWTRGLAVCGDVAFVGTSRVLPRFHQYAPGLVPDDCVCGVHAVDIGSGDVLASLRWPHGDQIFSVEGVPESFTSGLPSGPGRSAARQRGLFYDFTPKGPMTERSDPERET